MTSPQLSSKDSYDILGLPLGNGTYGVVNKIRIKEDKKEYALKIISLKKVLRQQDRENLLEESITEYKILRKNFGKVVRAYGSYYDSVKENFMFTMELFPNNLAEHIEQIYRVDKKQMTFRKFLPILCDVVTGLRNLYVDGKIIHRDLKPENILIREGRATLSDLGISKCFNRPSFTGKIDNINTIAGSENWMAPEMLIVFENPNNPIQSGTINQLKTDIFSLGLICLFSLDYNNYIRQGSLNNDPLKLDKYLTSLRKSLKLPGEFYYILRSMLSFSCHTRPDIEELFKDITNLQEKFSASKQMHEGEFESWNQGENDDIRWLSLDVGTIRRDGNDVDRLLICTQRLSSLKNIEHLDLKLNNQRVTDTELERLAGAIQEMKKLETLSLYLHTNHITDVGLGYIEKALDHQKMLKELSIYAHDLKISDEGIKKMSKSIGALQNLKKFYLSFGNDNISETAMEVVFKFISELNQLQHLGLLLDKAVNLTDASLTVFLHFFGKRKPLDEIRIFNTQDTSFSEEKKSYVEKNTVNLTFSNHIWSSPIIDLD